MGEMRNEYKILVGKLKRKDHMEDPCVDRRTILKVVLRKLSERLWSEFIWFRMGDHWWAVFEMQ
jgi:hypothetical protein